MYGSRGRMDERIDLAVTGTERHYLVRPTWLVGDGRNFVRTMAANEGSAKIVRSVVALGRDLSLEVVAEGVENAVMARTLRNQTSERRGMIARDVFTLCHYPIVLGIIFFAVAAR